MNACPHSDVLRAYEAGDLSEAQALPIERHIGACPACNALVERARASDVEARRLRSLLGDVLKDVAAGGHDVPGPAAGQAGPPNAESAVRPTPPGAATTFGSLLWPIPDYERVVLCGEGSYGSVWVVRDRVGVYRALKIIDLARLERAGVRCREREALEAYCRKISGHPYLVSIFHVGMTDQLLYYTMELADDQTRRASVGDRFPDDYRPLTLDTIIAGGRLQIDVALELGRRLLRGLAKMHAAELVHRDIKPSNIIFVHRHPKLADIGMVTSGAYGSRAAGTPEYMPPDYATDKTADVYAFGKVLYEMLAGPEGADVPRLPRSDAWVYSRWPFEPVQAVIARACAAEAAKRYPSAAEMLEDLEACTEPTVESLFEGLAAPPGGPRSDTAREAIRLGFAVVRLIPWIIGLIAFLALLNRLPAWLRGLSG